MSSPRAVAHPPAWTGTRVARPARDLAASSAFYRDLLGLQPRGGFEDHDGYAGDFFAVPGGGALELTAGPVASRGGFRLLSVDRDAFTPATGYPDPIMIDGIPLMDRVWLSADALA
jgi:catechol 2,3-dioxygenase-like lactoylglutathione lyase family enzyme